jgi:hypothetical protein
VPQLNTVRGEIDTADLGVTLMHEHVFVLSPEINDNHPDVIGDEAKREADAIERLNELKSRGVDSIVDLTVIGLGRYIPRIARIAASSLALRLGLTFAEIEDLRLAIDETVILLLRPEGDAGDITLEFTVAPGALVVDATTTAGTAQHWFDVGALSRFDEIVGDTVDVHEVDEAARHVHLVKRY